MQEHRVDGVAGGGKRWGKARRGSRGGAGVLGDKRDRGRGEGWDEEERKRETERVRGNEMGGGVASGEKNPYFT